MNPVSSEAPATEVAASPPSYPHRDLTRRLEQWRALCLGPERSLLQNLVLLVAVSFFAAGDVEKGLVASATSWGLLLAPLALYLIARVRWTVSRACGAMYLAAGVGLLAASFAGPFTLYLAGVLICLPLTAATAPLVTSIWRENIPDHERGSLFGWVSTLGLLGGLGATGLSALYMGDDAARYRPVLAAMALCLGLSALFMLRIPSARLRKPGRNPLAGLAWLWRDGRFGYVCLTWMVLGFSNLAVVPLRVVFLASPEFGLAYSPWLILLLCDALPSFVRMLSVRFWGRRFDTTNFIALRIVLNVCFLLNAALFFMPSLWGQVLAGVFFGLGQGGGEIAWNLWVTKFSPPERTAEYMGVHTFLTGLRGLGAPLLAFYLLGALGIVPIAWVCAGLMGLASLMLLPLLPLGRRMRDEANGVSE